MTNAARGVCPECGQADREPIAPGYWKCQGVIVERRLIGVDRGLAAEQPIYQSQQRPCGHLYQDGPVSAAELCSCGTYAIGQCVTCRQWLCGTCSKMTTGGRMCARDCGAHEAREAVAREAARQQARIRAAEFVKIGGSFTRETINVFVAAMAAAGFPGTKRLGPEGRCWPLRGTSTNRMLVTGRLGYREEMTQRVLATDGRLGSAAVSYTRPPDVKKRWRESTVAWVERRNQIERAWVSERLYSAFQPLAGTPDDQVLRFELRELARRHAIQPDWPARPTDLPVRPNPGTGVVEYAEGAAPHIARVLQDGWDQPLWVNRDGVSLSPGYPPLRTGMRVRFDLALNPNESKFVATNVWPLDDSG